MEYQVFDPDDITATPDRPCVQRAIGDRAGLEHVAVNRYEAAPGEALPLAYHYHDEQEELFYVLAGELAVETLEGVRRVPAGQVFVAGPESPHYARAAEDADGVTSVLAVGAPRVDDVHPYEGGEAP